MLIAKKDKNNHINSTKINGLTDLNSCDNNTLFQDDIIPKRKKMTLINQNAIALLITHTICK